MKRYRFPLQALVVVRTHQESVARDTFAAAVQALVQAEEELTHARTQRDDLANLLRTGRTGRFSASAQAQGLVAFQQQSTIVEDSERVVRAARARMEASRRDYLESHRKLEGLERLDERGRNVHRLETNRQEQAEFDDFAGGRVTRKRLSCP